MKHLAILAALAVTIGIATPAHADMTPVTKTYRTYWSYDYTIGAGTVDLITASPTQGNPVTTGGCAIVSHRNTRGKVIIGGVKCATPGTVRYTTPDYPACGSTFTIVADGATVFADSIGPTCQPATPAVQTALTASTTTFTNPASVEQSATVERTVDRAHRNSPGVLIEFPHL